MFNDRLFEEGLIIAQKYLQHINDTTAATLQKSEMMYSFMESAPQHFVLGEKGLNNKDLIEFIGLYQTDSRHIWVMRFGPHSSNGQGTTQGGCLASVIDCCSGFAGGGLTAYLTVNYLKPTRIGHLVVLDCAIDYNRSKGDRKVYVNSKLFMTRAKDGDGFVQTVSSESLLIVPKQMSNL